MDPEFASCNQTLQLIYQLVKSPDYLPFSFLNSYTVYSELW